MLVRLDEIREEGIERSFSVAATHYPELQAVQGSGEVKFSDQLHFVFTLCRAGNLVEVSGTLRSAITLYCGRCLTEFQTALSSGFELTFSRETVHRAVAEGDDEIELSTEDLGLITFTGDEINLDDIVEEQVLLALPFRPLCSEACRGLCPDCGIDLNQHECDCARGAFRENKFAALQNLKINK